jgi:hypothetical protein
MPVYWGPQPFTSGPVYLGAIVVFLFVLSLFIVKGPIKWWAVAITILSILLAWGKNLMWLTDLFLDYFPLYNKFRTVSMILVMAELTIPLMAILGLQRILEWEIDKKKLITYGKYSLIITGGVLLFFSFFAGSLFSFNSPNDAASGLPEWLMAALKEDRKALLQRDVMRSLVFILITSALLWAYVAGKLKKVHVLIILPLLFLADMWPVNKRYLNNDDFVRQSVAERPFQATAADQAILEDSKLYYRVFNLTEALDKSARTSYFHKNIGGYHGAKLRRYQEMIDFPLRAERNKLVSVLNSQATMEDIHQTLESMPATRMLNTRYFILNNDSEPLFNPFALGNAWFVSKVEVVNNADEEIAAISNLDPKREAIVDKRFSSYLDAHPFQNSNAGKIRLTDYRPNRLVYQYDSPANQFAVFSEIFYDKGWKAIIDGEEVPHIRVNYILRGMVLPAGEHEIEFVFEPKSYYVGEKVSLVSSLIILLLLSGYVVGRLMKSKRS